jgi:hypothetical protein
MQYLQKQNNTDKDLLEYQSLLKELESRNIFKLPSEGPITFKDRLLREIPEHKQFILRIDRYIERRYGPK